MVVIRLARGGAKKAPFYHVVVADSRKARGGRFIERLGFYNPMARGPETHLQLDQERVAYWTERGAQPSERVSLLLHRIAKGEAINQAAPKKAELKTAQIAASQKAAKAKAKAETEAAKAEEKTEEKSAE
ncbi:MAG: 30S ribosomal protein S16 [Gammaproteobacteria bacterium CG_4_10_14_0_8_um_filter_38_16]|nr:MAG: 30S ribosomal protein S16 [Gammaproteobacteria bacterium CG_4_10_14_0_8_um_filter_38_16]PJA03301.1 MAG: 30S ribosomal protein S16 [Gammaproteobacteria bacterium CG_4_10_14_0_2_um_filter_38_22]PJB10346.1 MAG: 30S ribosomal protein S16 [Gammaproteobacteria bacterium CG_4_9_14_3_um_filter_38_9]